VDELDLFRDLGGGPVAPSDDVRQLASVRLAAAIQREQVDGATEPCDHTRQALTDGSVREFVSTPQGCRRRRP
jgi:hypothetical protein